MAATAAQVERVRRWIGEPSEDNATISDAIESYPLKDERGTTATILSYSSGSPVWAVNPGWIPSYDLHAAAADLLESRAGSAKEKMDFSTNDQSFKVSQQFEQLMKLVRYHRSRRCGVGARIMPMAGGGQDLPILVVNAPEYEPI